MHCLPGMVSHSVNEFIICVFYESWNYESTNLFTKVWFILYRHFFLNSKLLPCRKTNQRKIRRFVYSGIVKICDELDLRPTLQPVESTVEQSSNAPVIHFLVQLQRLPRLFNKSFLSNNLFSNLIIARFEKKSCFFFKNPWICDTMSWTAHLIE